MIKTALLLFLAAHLIGDVYGQTDKMMDGKNQRWPVWALHALIYAATVAAVFLPVWDAGMIPYLAAVAAAHAVIDAVGRLVHAGVKRSRLMAWLVFDKEPWLLGLDQALHGLVFFTAAGMMVQRGVGIELWQPIGSVFALYGVDAGVLLPWICLILFVGKPVNVLFVRLFSNFKPVSASMEDEGTRKAGATIGILERLIVVILLGLHQYAAIGLVLTAKSIARYEKITKDVRFGEYYLLGTLSSVLLAMAGYAAIVNMAW